MNDEIKKITEKINAKLKEIRKRKNMLKGSINKVHTKCGNANCKCARGFKHESAKRSWYE